MRLSTLPPGLWELTGLEDLSVAGNELTQIPDQIGELGELRRLVAAGNALRALPGGVAALPSLEGLWAHGNALKALPEGIGGLASLQTLSLAGNRLASLPPDVAALTSLSDLSVSGNRLAALPDALPALPALKRLAANGNELTQLPGGWGGCSALTELHLQGNQIEELPHDFARLPALVELSLADNRLRRLPADLSALTSLQKLYLYGNELQDLPLGGSDHPDHPVRSDRGGGGLLDLPSLTQVWLEGNPLSPAAVAGLLRRLAAAGGGGGGGGKLPPRLKAVGLDERQLAGVDAGLVDAALAAAPGVLRVARVCGGPGPGYFKLQRQARATAGDWAGRGGARVLVVAFGSAPGLPNWGGALRQVEAAMEKEGNGGTFDTLFVCDPRRDWYGAGDAAAMADTYSRRIEAAAADYERVLMVGDSMGATAALLFSKHATAVLSFCPQVDLRTASIRPGRPAAWLDAAEANIHEALASTSARVQVLTGTWQHDLQQVSLLERHACCRLKAFSHDSHRLALALARGGKLAPLLQEAISNEAGLPSKNVRIANIL
ncbi:MAG: hypothetical protein J3K34DRAFT_78350 [Monoraphidium minutum]|nr:MAG: hypothetical protein J3K34DRAFT_78350 [Monoraphidium minutum]